MARPQIPVGQWGEITIRQLPSGVWRARTKFRDQDGRLREVSRQAPTRARVNTAIKQALREREGAILDSSASVKTIVQQWLAEIEQSDLAVSTKRVYKQMATHHLSEGNLAEASLDDLTVASLAAFLRNMALNSGEGAAKTVRACLRGSLDLAVELGVMESNPVRLVSPRKGAAGRKRAEVARDTRRALTPAERLLLTGFIEADEQAQRLDLPDLVAFMLGTGVRIGEACALRWSRVDLTEGCVLIDSTVIRVPGEGLRIQPHTKTGEDRRLYLPASLVERLAKRERWHEVVFPSPMLKLRDVSNTEHALKALFTRAGLSWMTSHTLRKTAATRMDEAGLTAREVANQLGHRQISTAQNFYLDRTQPSRRAAEVLE